MSAKLIVISGPSGAGIGEIVAALFARSARLVPVVPVTARKMKEGERDGVGFYFFELEGWNAMKESGDLLETTEFAGNDYGTSRKLVEEQLAQGKSVLMERELDRAAQIKRNMPEALSWGSVCRRRRGCALPPASAISASAATISPPPRPRSRACSIENRKKEARKLSLPSFFCLFRTPFRRWRSRRSSPRRGKRPPPACARPGSCSRPGSRRGP